VISGRSSAAAGLYWQPEQVHVGEARLRPNTLDDFRLTPFWQYASDSGRRVAVIDAVYAPPAPGLNGVLLRDWGAHSAGFGRGSDPRATWTTSSLGTATTPSRTATRGRRVARGVVTSTMDRAQPLRIFRSGWPTPLR
jgi:hypothetical protein